MADTNMKTVHHGRNVKRFREMLGIKQEALATELGDDWTQKKIFLLESKETIEPDILEHVAKALKVPAEAIRNFDEEQAIFNIQNNYEGSNNQGANLIYQSTLNPVDKWLEALNEIKRLSAALLKEKDEKIQLLEKMLDKK